ncbi:MAG TPA: YMGG-like glycine zipper-containing protein [Candidatus Hydrogenedentes bacterium]|nr:YMGG-like glycine zipper-containing protein [Candidatus Hydrogenedentota bacterium]
MRTVRWRIMMCLVTLPVWFSLSACQTTPVQQGALAGSVLGAGAGALAGATMGRPGEGALIGAGAGALAGALIADDIAHGKPPLEARASSTVVTSPPPPPPQIGYYKWEVRRGPNGEQYEQRVWIPR